MSDQQQHRSPNQSQEAPGSNQEQQQHGRHFLADANAAASAAAVGRPIRGSGAVMPDVSAHAWNVNVADFVPTPSAAGVGCPPAAAPSGDDAAAQLAAQMLSGLRSATDREQVEAKLAASLAQLRRWAKTRSDCEQLVRSLVRLACSERSFCEPASELLAHLALNFNVSEKENPQLFDRTSTLSHLPIYLALMRHCSAENDALRRHLVAQKTATEEKAGYALFFCLLYACLPSPNAPTDRQQAIAKASLQLLNLLAGLSDCPAAFRAVQAALLSVGEILDIDSVNSGAGTGAVNGGEDEATPARLLETLYDQLRQAVVHCRIGDVALATDIIRLLELRASGWGRPPAGFSAAASVSNASQSMTDDMYADYEQFLRESGQL